VVWLVYVFCGLSGLGGSAGCVLCGDLSGLCGMRDFAGFLV